jgi:AmmeMemoRadiSam system protein B
MQRMPVVRNPAVAGQFYAEHVAELSMTVAQLLDEAKAPETAAPKAIVAPHAGYMYSGAVAAAAYACLQPYRSRYRRVILLGPCHRTPLSGVALSGVDAFRMPTGDVPLDREAIETIDLPGVAVMDEAHATEHSLEVHLPFLQAVLDDFSLVPIIVGETSADFVADVLDALWGGPETLIVVSSDLSHYLPYSKAQVIDARTCSAIERMQGDRINHSMACGATVIRGLLLAAKRRGMTVTTIDLCNSGDTSGERGAVVGYGAWVVTEAT